MASEPAEPTSRQDTAEPMPEPTREEMLASLTELITQTVPGDLVELLQSTLDAQHALQVRTDAALAEIANWWGTGKPGGRTLMAVNSILRGQCDALLAEQVEGRPPADSDPRRQPPAAVPCGNPDTSCGRRGGTARCGGCAEDEPRAPFTTADQAFPEEF